ncbi:MAG: hypothetical protein ABI175_06640 [Polyangiales bacterium]
MGEHSLDETTAADAKKGERVMLIIAGVLLAQTVAPPSAVEGPAAAQPVPLEVGAVAEERRTALLANASFLLPGAQYVAWVPLRKDREGSTGAGFELSYARHLANAAAVLGVVAQAEKLDRWRVGGGLEAGWELVGLEISGVRELANSERAAQWSLQLAPYVSFGFVTLSARWIVGLTNRGNPDAPGDGALVVLGFKVPIRLDRRDE